MTALVFALRYMTTVVALAKAGFDVRDIAEQGRDRVQAMVNEGRDPTPDEQAQLDALMLANKAVIDAAVAG